MAISSLSFSRGVRFIGWDQSFALTVLAKEAPHSRPDARRGAPAHRHHDGVEYGADLVEPRLRVGRRDQNRGDGARAAPRSGAVERGACVIEPKLFGED